MSVDFEALLNTSIDDVEKPKPLPVGHYKAVVKSFEFGKADNERQTPRCRFMIQPIEPQEDVDIDALQQVNKWSEKPLRLDQWITEDAMWRFKQFLERDCRLPTNGRSFNEVVPESVNQLIIIEITHTISRGSGDAVAIINSTSPVTDD